LPTRLHTDIRLAETSWEAVAALVLARPWAGRCERCGKEPPTDPHHRWLRSQGGLDVPSNLAALGRSCHDWCHRNPAEATAGGWMVQAPWDFRGTPVRLWDGLLVRYGDDYGYEILEWAA
jgi:hypothetical protein